MAWHTVHGQSVPMDGDAFSGVGIGIVDRVVDVDDELVA